MLKADADLRLIPVIALTAHAIAGEREKALDAGCDEYITKPMDLGELVEAVNYWVTKK
jgi:CheY-like chemotaxis protein